MENVDIIYYNNSHKLYNCKIGSRGSVPEDGDDLNNDDDADDDHDGDDDDDNDDDEVKKEDEEKEGNMLN